MFVCDSLGEPLDGIRRICGNDVVDKCSPVWGMNEEGEIRGTWREIGPPNLWYMMGECRVLDGNSLSDYIAYRILCPISVLF